MFGHVVLFGMELLRLIQKTFGKNIAASSMSAGDSSSKSSAEISRAPMYIENQHSLSNIPFGKADMAGCGCEVIAVYNAILALGGSGKVKSLNELIHVFEKDGMLLNGKFGTSPKALRDFLIRENYDIRYTSSQGKFDEIARASSTCIITFFNDKYDIRKQIHTVCLTKENGKYIAHNLHCNGKVYGPYSSVTEFITSINNHRAKGIYLIGIRDGIVHS